MISVVLLWTKWNAVLYRFSQRVLLINKQINLIWLSWINIAKVSSSVSNGLSTQYLNVKSLIERSTLLAMKLWTEAEIFHSLGLNSQSEKSLKSIMWLLKILKNELRILYIGINSFKEVYFQGDLFILSTLNGRDSVTMRISKSLLIKPLSWKCLTVLHSKRFPINQKLFSKS